MKNIIQLWLKDSTFKLRIGNLFHMEVLTIHQLPTAHLPVPFLHFQIKFLCFCLEEVTMWAWSSWFSLWILTLKIQNSTWIIWILFMSWKLKELIRYLDLSRKILYSALEELSSIKISWTLKDSHSK